MLKYSNIIDTLVSLSAQVNVDEEWDGFESYTNNSVPPENMGNIINLFFVKHNFSLNNLPHWDTHNIYICILL